MEDASEKLELDIKELLFPILPINDTCTWYGTEWEGEGKEAKVLPCGEPTIGAAIFKDLIGKTVEYHSVCERHKGTK